MVAVRYLKDKDGKNAGEIAGCLEEDLESYLKRGIVERLEAPAKAAEKPGPQHRAVPVKP